MMRSAFSWPRSVMVTMTDLRWLRRSVTRTRLPKGSVSVSGGQLEHVESGVRWRCDDPARTLPYQLAMPVKSAARGLWWTVGGRFDDFDRLNALGAVRAGSRLGPELARSTARAKTRGMDDGKAEDTAGYLLGNSMHERLPSPLQTTDRVIEDRGGYE